MSSATETSWSCPFTESFIVTPRRPPEAAFGDPLSLEHDTGKSGPTLSDWPCPSEPPARALTPGPSPVPRPPSLTGRGETSNARTQEWLHRCALPLLPVREGGRGREKRAGVMRANAKAKVNLTKSDYAGPSARRPSGIPRMEGYARRGGRWNRPVIVGPSGAKQDCHQIWRTAPSRRSLMPRFLPLAFLAALALSTLNGCNKGAAKPKRRPRPPPRRPLLRRPRQTHRSSNWP